MYDAGWKQVRDAWLEHGRSVRAAACLSIRGIRTVEQIRATTSAELKGPNIGRVTIAEIRAFAGGLADDQRRRPASIADRLAAVEARLAALEAPQRTPAGFDVEATRHAR